MPTAILKPAHEVALILTMRAAKTEKGRAVQSVVLFRVECGMWINEAIKSA